MGSFRISGGHVNGFTFFTDPETGMVVATACGVPGNRHGEPVARKQAELSQWIQRQVEPDERLGESLSDKGEIRQVYSEGVLSVSTPLT